MEEVEFSPEPNEEHEAVDKVESDPNPALAARWKELRKEEKGKQAFSQLHVNRTCTSRKA